MVLNHRKTVNRLFNTYRHVPVQLHIQACIPESVVMKVPTAEGLEPYSFTASTDQLYCVLCWRLVREREVAVMPEKVRAVEVLARLTV